MSESRPVLNAVVETVPDGILVVDDDREFVTYNENFVEMWEIPSRVIESGDDSEALDSVLELLERPGEFLDTVDYFYDHPDEVGRDRIRLTDGRVFERFTAPATDATGTYVGRIWVFEDVTERTRSQRELRRQNERLEEFASVVSHDLRNPLAVAQGRLDLLRAEVESDHLTAVESALGRMETLIDDLLSLARTGEATGPVSPTAVGAVARESWEGVPTREATLEVATDPQVVADAEHLRELLENLFHNAVQHGGPRVTVTVGATADGFFVSDDGPGVPASERDAVFEPGYTTADSGTGFGLRIVAEIADAHDWEVDLEESASGGARFTVRGVEFA